MSQVPISGLPPLATPLNPALQFEVAFSTITSSKVTLAQILTDPIITGAPTISDFTLAIHDHSDNTEGGQLTNNALIAGVFSSITGLGTQSQALSMGINNILQAGFLEMREITTPAVPLETAGRLYVKDVLGITTLFFLDHLGTDTDLLAFGAGTFLPLAGGTMDALATITFTNTASGGNPVISAVESPTDQTLQISDSLKVPETIFVGTDGWNITSDGESDFLINTPTGDGSHNFDVDSAQGRITLENTSAGNDFTAKFLTVQKLALSTTTAIALTIEAEIVDGTDEGTNPVIAIDAHQAAAAIDTRPILGISNNGSIIWEISKDGIVTQFNNLIMGSNDIQFEDTDHRIHQHEDDLELHTASDSQVRMSIGEVEGEFTYQFGPNNANFQRHGIADMGVIQFQPPTTTPPTGNVSIQRGNTTEGTINDLQLDTENGGEIVLRIFDTPDDEEYNFSAIRSDWNGNELQNAVMTNTVTGTTLITGLGVQTQALDLGNNDLENAVMTNTVTGVSAITGLGTQTQSLNMGAKFITNVFEINFEGINNDILAITRSFTNDTLRVNGNAGIELEAGVKVQMIMGSTTYDFQDGSVDWDGNNLINMGVLQFGTGDDANVSIERVNAGDMQIDIDEGGTLFIRENNIIEYTFDDTFADWKGNDLENVGTLLDLGTLDYARSTTTLIATNRLIPTTTFTRITAESGTVDDLEFIEDGGIGEMLLITPSENNIITVKNTGLLNLINDADFVMNDVQNYMGLIFGAGGEWTELFRNGNHINSIVGTPSKGMDAVTVDGITTLSITEDLIAGQTPAVPESADELLFRTSGGALRRAKFSELAFSMIAGTGQGHTIGADRYLSFFDHDDPDGDNELREIPLPAAMRISDLVILVGTNGKSEAMDVGVAVNGVLQPPLTITIQTSEEDQVIPSTGFVDVAIGERISFFVESSTGTGNIEIISFACLMTQLGS